jgi:hypothetical protein
MLSLGLCQLEQQVKSSPPPRMLDMEEGNQPAIIICCSGTRAPPWAVLSGVPVYSLLLQVQVLGNAGKAQEQSFCGWLLRAWDMRNLSLLFGSSLVPVFS